VSTSNSLQFMQKLAAQLVASRRPASGPSPAAPSDQGLTLIECLVAIIVIALVVGTVTPALVISAATRVQSQKTEQAIKVAQGEIDRVRSIVERGFYTSAELPQSTPVAPETKTLPDGREYTIEYPENVVGPLVGSLVGESTAYSDQGPLQARQVDVDGDGAVDLAIQVYRSPGRLDVASSTPVNFTMGVRVYDIEAFQGTNVGNLLTDEAAAAVTGGEGDRSRLPLAVLYTSIAKADIENAYCDYFEYLGSTPSVNFECN
jgi:prepilin-type N-terminal cleavage/methylation domain-containing protein